MFNKENFSDLLDDWLRLNCSMLNFTACKCDKILCELEKLDII